MLDDSVDELVKMLNEHQPSILAIAAGLITYVSWRLWNFTLKPLLRKDDPKPLPYSIPFLGHTYWFMTDPDGLFKRGYSYVKRGEPFAVRLGAKNIVILTSNRDVATVWKDTEALTFDPFVQQIMGVLGMSKKIQSILYQEHPESLVQSQDKSNSLLISANPYHKAFYHLQMDWVKQQLSGNMLTEIGDRFLGYINDSLQLHRFSPSFVLASAPNEQTVSLKKWVRYALVDSASKAFFGQKMGSLHPDFIFNYFAFEEAAWKMLYQYPRFLAQDLFGSAEKVLSAMDHYYDVPQSDRPDTMWMFKTIETEMRNLGVQPHDISIMSFMLFWGSNNNAHIIAFWTVAHILMDPKLQTSIRAETDRACSHTSSSVDLEILKTQCPTLDAVWHEVLRLYTSVSLVRVAIRPTTVNRKTVREGDQVMGPFRQFHLNRETFGDDAREWNPERFLRNKDLARNKGFNPFGGGTTYCPGRFLAKQEVYVVVALILWRFDLDMKGAVMPGMNEKEPSLGGMRPIGDILVKVRAKRKQ